MKSIVINLAERADRLKLFKENNKDKADDIRVFSAVDGKEVTMEKLWEKGFDTDKNWRDPELDRVLTWGEIGCFLSHFTVWEMIAAGDEAVLVMEDDVVLYKNLSEIETFLGDRELLYLTHNEMKPGGVKPISEELVQPCYPYWLAAYILTPSGARKLIEGDIRRNIIPADEYVPRMLDRIDVAAFKEPVAQQISRDTLGTNIEPRSESDYVVDFTTHVLTCGSDGAKMKKLTESAERLGIKPVNIVQGKWQGTTMEGPGGGQKLVDLQAYINRNKLPDHDVILFTDAYDVFYGRDLDVILGRFLGYKREIVFSAEKHLWPDKSLSFPPTHTPYRYLNSGTFIGRVGEIKRMIQKPIQKHEDDQLYLQKEFLTGKFDAALDVESYIFCTHEETTQIQNGMIYNPITGCYSCIYHGNGGGEAKAKFEYLYNQLHPEIKYAYVKDYQEIGNEMLLIDCFSEEDCQRWIDISEAHGGWNPHPDDKFPSHDIHIKELGLWEEWSDHWKRVIAPITNKYWQPSMHYHLRKAFTMKYSTDTQKTLGLHTDAALVTGSMKLNNDYEGATLIFPRQGVTNEDIPIGKLILFPGPLTHGHYVNELRSGTKYSFTTWTARNEGDLLNP